VSSVFSGKDAGNTRDGTLTIRHEVVNGVDATARIRYSLNAGSTWSGWTTSTTTVTDTTATLTAQDVSLIHVEAENNGTANSGDEHRVTLIYFVGDLEPSSTNCDG